MASSFIAYIDESGDEGFTFHPDGTGSSRWFVLSAVVFRRPNDLLAVAALKRARATLGWDAKKSFHFADMKHDQRLVLLHELAPLSFRTITIVSFKPDIPDCERYQANKWMLYRYLTRLLIERISWLCRDSRRPGEAEGDGTVDLIFSDRAAMSYEDIKAYIRLLQQQANAGSAEVQIHWPAIKLDQLRAVAHNQLAGLQVADAIASSYFSAIRLNRFGIGTSIRPTRAYRVCYGPFREPGSVAGDVEMFRPPASDDPRSTTRFDQPAKRPETAHSARRGTAVRP